VNEKHSPLNISDRISVLLIEVNVKSRSIFHQHRYRVIQTLSSICQFASNHSKRQSHSFYILLHHQYRQQ